MHMPYLLTHLILVIRVKALMFNQVVFSQVFILQEKSSNPLTSFAMIQGNGMTFYFDARYHL